MLKLSHALIYAALSGSYAGACVGLDKTWIAAITAALYFLLAILDWRKHR